MFIDVRGACAQFRANERLAAQGGGGNASWKQCETLWVKASGTRLSEAQDKTIFVPVDLPPVRERLAKGDFSTHPKAADGGDLRPSIETLLHALMPQKYVLHVHAIDPLALLVGANPRAAFAATLASDIAWCLVDYFKPGANLAKAVSEAADDLGAMDVVMLANHGIVVAAETVSELNQKLARIIESVRQPVQLTPPTGSSSASLPVALAEQYAWSKNQDLDVLACDATALGTAKTAWVLYPDHAVFLGPRAVCCPLESLAVDAPTLTETAPDFILVEGAGVLVSSTATQAAREQLLCYADVVVRLRTANAPVPLRDADVADLLDWDAEKYRQSLAAAQF